MKSSRFILRYWLPVFLWAAVIFGLSSWSGESTPDISFPMADKLTHFFLFGMLACLLGRVLSRTWPRRLFLTVLVTIAAVSLYGLTDEFHQCFTPERSAEMMDWVADTAGSLLVIPFILWYKKGLTSDTHIEAGRIPNG
ncbi:MAG: VanZ family protein [Verrucomicrobia bacterium]|nr:VanZ family protein [Verrucomicrobiota bacterium]